MNFQHVLIYNFFLIHDVHLNWILTSIKLVESTICFSIFLYCSDWVCQYSLLWFLYTLYMFIYSYFQVFGCQHKFPSGWRWLTSEILLHEWQYHLRKTRLLYDGDYRLRNPRLCQWYLDIKSIMEGQTSLEMLDMAKCLLQLARSC